MDIFSATSTSWKAEITMGRLWQSGNLGSASISTPNQPLLMLLLPLLLLLFGHCSPCCCVATFPDPTHDPTFDLVRLLLLLLSDLFCFPSVYVCVCVFPSCLLCTLPSLILLFVCFLLPVPASHPQQLYSLSLYSRGSQTDPHTRRHSHFPSPWTQTQEGL